MEISFTTKEESKAVQQEAFLQLSGGERVMRFIKLSETILRMFPPSIPTEKSNNFVIDASMKRK
jgi:hypothetical protein